MAAALPQVQLWTDGSCRGNPGGPGGWAAVIRYEGRDLELSGSEPWTDANRMELMALVCGLRAIPMPAQVRVFTDSAYVKDPISKKWVAQWKRNAWTHQSGKPVSNQDLWMELIMMLGRHELKMVKVKGHSGVELNERADRLATAAADEILVTRTFAPPVGHPRV
jgi:ribonuclease HI